MSAAFGGFFKISSYGYVDNRVLAANVDETITRPAGYTSCVFTPDTNCWINPNGAAAIPGADVTDGSGSILCPAGVARIIDFTPKPSNGAITLLASIHVIASAVTLASIEWFK